MAKWKIERIFRGLNEENYQLILNFRKSLYWDELVDTTIYTYSKDVYRFMLFLQDKNINTFDATSELLQEYLDTLEVKARRKLKIVSAITLFYKHLKKRKKLKNKSILNFDTTELRNEFKKDEFIRVNKEE